MPEQTTKAAAPGAPATASPAPVQPAPDSGAWVGQRFLAAVSADPSRIIDGAELARLNRVVRMDVTQGRIDAHVRDRSTRPERVVIEVDTHAHDVWERAIAHIADQPSQAARILAGMLPEDIESALASSGVALFPAPGSLEVSCRCDDPEPWCRHAYAVAATLARELTVRPLQLLTLRGMPAEEALELLRQRRALQGRTRGDAPAYAQRPAPGADTAAPPLEASLENYWTAGHGLDTLDSSLRTPEVSCALLRRLGPSPLEPARFPLLGLLETCYDVISKATVAADEAQTETDPDAEPGDDAPPDDQPD